MIRQKIDFDRREVKEKIMDKQAREAKEMVRQMPLHQQLKHYWEYYKAQIIAIAVSIILIVVTVVGAVIAPKYDIEVAYYGDTILTEEQELKLEEYLASQIEDINDDGECKVDIVVSRFKLNNATEDEYQMAMAQKFATEVAVGAYPAFILDAPHTEYAGMADEREDGILETATDMRNDTYIAELLGENEIYWCTRILYDKEIGKEEPEALHNNAVLIEKSFK